MINKKRHSPFSLVAVFILLLLNFSNYSLAEELIKVDEALKKIYPKATQFNAKSFVLSEEQISILEEKAKINFGGNHSSQVQMTIVREGDQILGFAFEDTVVGKWGPIHYLVGLDAQGTVLQVIVLDYREIRGKPVAKKRFLRQYKKKSVDDPVKLRRDIDGVTGATISSRSLTNGIRKLLFIFEEYGVKINEF